ncbi:MAG: threonyl-tRNA synthetase editing domain-containing protein [Bacteroidales bacterium]|nr:threonyl-tRNA synthetase editing domain-containing protein [Bacteroidales bacterium]
MTVLFIYCKKFGYTPTVKTVECVADNKNAAGYYENIQTAFVQVEEEDIAKNTEVEKKLVKNLKWICSKNQVKKLVLHSFAHLSESKADPGFTMQLFNNIEERMKNVGYEVHQTPFGYFLDLQLDAPGFSLARIFKSI